MITFIEEHRVAHGVEPICRVLPIAPSTFYAHAAIARDPGLASDRAKQDAIDRKKIKDAFDDSGKRYGARKIWHELRRNNHDIARCTVERLMKAIGIQGVVRGQKPITTNPDTSQPCPDDKVNRDFTASMPNQLWVSDFTYVLKWSCFLGQVCGLAKMHLVYVHAAFRVSLCSKYAASGVRLSRAV